MKGLKLSLIAVGLFIIGGCSGLRPVVYTGSASLNGYKYAYVTPTSGIVSGSGEVYGNQSGVYGSATSRSINPADIISGIMMKNGYILVSEISDEIKDRTLIVNYAETGRRDVYLIWDAVEITVQVVSADTYELLCTCTAERLGDDADDVRNVIARAMEKMFQN